MRQKVGPEVYGEAIIWNETVLAFTEKNQAVGTFVEANIVQIKPQPMITIALFLCLLLAAFIFVLTLFSIEKATRQKLFGE